MDGFIQIHRKILEWEWYDDIPTKVLFLHILFKANYTKKNWRGIEILPGQLLTGRKTLAQETGLGEQQVRRSLEKLKKTQEITIKTTSEYSMLTLNNWDTYNQQMNQRPTNDQPTTNQRPTTTNKDNKDNKETVSIDTEQAPTFGKEEINMMQGFLRQAVGLDKFKDSKERWYVQHCYVLMKNIGREEFQFRLRAILSDQFKAKNCNKLAYLYGELKSYIHSPVIPNTPKVW